MAQKMARILRLGLSRKALTLTIDWEGGERTPVDLTGLIESTPALAPLADPAVFRQAATVERGHGVEWPGGLDVSADTLRIIADEQRAMTGREFARWQRALHISNQEAADLLGVSLSTVKKMHGLKTVSIPVQVTCRTMLRERIVFSAHYRPRRSGRPRKAAAD